MTDTLRDLLRRELDGVEAPVLDPNQVMAEGEQRLHRRRVTAVLAAAAAVAVIAAGSIIAGSGRQQSQGPVEKPDEDRRAVAPHTREIVWSDDLDRGRVGTLHVGERETEIDQVLHSVMDWSMFVTDAGVVYAQDDHSVWFTDGRRPRQVAAHACVVAAGADDDLGVATGNAGPLAAWFDCSTASRGDLVVYDTHAGREVARQRVPLCVGTGEPSHLPSSRAACTPDAVVGKHVYFERLHGSADQTRTIEHQFRFDVTSGRIERAGQRAYLDDLRAQRRTLVIGDTWESGTPTEAAGQGEWYLRPVGTRLVPMALGGPGEDDDAPTRVFTVNGRSVGFRLPAGYQPPPSDVGVSFSIFEWLDDDTVALAQGGFSTVGDIVVCRLSDGHCRLAVRAAGIVPGLPLPG